MKVASAGTLSADTKDKLSLKLENSFLWNFVER